MSNLNINQFAQVAVRGQTDQQISRSGIIQGIVSAANTTTPIAPGDCVNLDPAVTVVGAPQFITSNPNGSDVSFGYMIYDPKSSSVLTPGVIQVAMRWVGPVIWLVAGGTIAPGALVEQVVSSSVYDVVTFGTSTSKVRGLALDPGSIGQLLRIVLVGAPY